MPQLMSHRDGFGWQTPNTEDVLERVPEVGGKTGQLRIHATLMMRRLAQLGTPVRLQGVEAFPSHTRYHMLPDKTGMRGAERSVTLEDLQVTVPQVMSEVNDQMHELVRLNPDNDLITLFLRTAIHHPLNLLSLVEQSGFVEPPSYTLLPLGADLNQKPILRDLQALRHLGVVGIHEKRLEPLLSIAITLMLFNSPSYVRLTLAGVGESRFRHLAGSPHVLGSIIPSAHDFSRLIDGLLKHMMQRRHVFSRHLVESLDDYNKQAISNKELKPLPRIVVLLDTVGLPDWGMRQNDLVVPLHQILQKGADYGIHLVMTARSEHHIPERLKQELGTYILLGSQVNPNTKRLSLVKHIPSRFVDGFLIERRQAPIPLELTQVIDSELARMVNHWQKMKALRDSSIHSKSGRIPTGNTGLLTLRADMQPESTTPAPDKAAPTSEAPVIADQMVASAQALAGYLGWLSVGPLLDVLNMTPVEAQETLRILRTIGVLEAGEGPIWRFLRLADPPTPSEGR